MLERTGANEDLRAWDVCVATSMVLGVSLMKKYVAGAGLCGAEGRLSVREVVSMVVDLKVVKYEECSRSIWDALIEALAPRDKDMGICCLISRLRNHSPILGSESWDERRER